MSAQVLIAQEGRSIEAGAVHIRRPGEAHGAHLVSGHYWDNSKGKGERGVMRELARSLLLAGQRKPAKQSALLILVQVVFTI